MMGEAFYTCQPTLLRRIGPNIFARLRVYACYRTPASPLMFGNHAPVDLAIDALPLS